MSLFIVYSYDSIRSTMGKENNIVHYQARKRQQVICEADMRATDAIRTYFAGIDYEEDQQQEEVESSYGVVKDALTAIDKEIRKRKKRRVELLPGLYDVKNTLVLFALQLRSNGEERIRVKMENHSTRSRFDGRCKISFFDNGISETYSTFAKLSVLDSHDDLSLLVGRPDGILRSKSAQRRR